MTKGIITGIISNLVTIECDGPVAQNEICYIQFHDIRLMTEVIRISGSTAFAQVFESTRSVKTGMNVDFTGRMLEICLGPGLLSKNYDGLQNDLDKLPELFIPRGVRSDPLDSSQIYAYESIATMGDAVKAGDWIGRVKENWIDHKIMVPFSFQGTGRIVKIAENGDYTVDTEIAVIENNAGKKVPVTMRQYWPVKIPIKAFQSKTRPGILLETGIRSIDSLNPMTEGGTGFIPGAFGCGKTVLQHAMSKNAAADLIIIVACGERANEVVEIFKEYPELDDPRTGRKLIERTSIICNTSNMPVAAREASIYTGMTMAEYYRSMGLKVLLLADSTSRWAQALREMSNRLEELPGQDAFPMDLSAVISNFYARAGFVYLNNGSTGSVTFIGTVSPAGGNFKEPVTECTRKAAQCFYALSQKRADTKRYPAIDPIESYSKYLEYPELQSYLDDSVVKGWTDNVQNALDILRRGIEAYDQINILGDDSVPLEYHDHFWKSELIDFVFLQQDAFDKIDGNTPMKRQSYMLKLLLEICSRKFSHSHHEELARFYKQLINILKQMNYQEFESDEFLKYRKDLMRLADSRSKSSSPAQAANP